jgi:hypothetical protein
MTQYNLTPLKKPLSRVVNIKESTFDGIYNLLEPRLNVLGEIRANDAWHLCKFRTKYGYNTITTVFRQVIYAMVEQGKAVKIRHGIYKIVKPNNKIN